MSKPDWRVTQENDSVFTIKVPSERNSKWEQWALLQSDVHFDHPHCLRGMFKKHLDQAKERNAIVVDIGDFFCAMQSRDDRRGDKGSIRPENQEQDYKGSLVRGAYEFLKDYGDILAIRGKGNHETAMLKHGEFDPTRGLVDRLRDSGSGALVGGYRGWVRFMLVDKNKPARSQQFRMYFTHGSGGSAPVTKGVIRTNRRASFVDADIVVGGHIHEAWAVELRKAKLNDMGREYLSDQIHLCVPTYKEEFLEHSGGFHHEKEGSPKPVGAWWLRFFHDSADQCFKLDYARAK